MTDIRRGDFVEVFGGHAEVQRVESNSEGGLNITLKYAEKLEELSQDVLRAGGPDEREDDKDIRPEDVHLAVHLEEPEPWIGPGAPEEVPATEPAAEAPAAEDEE